jgi:hypothetical protein
MASFTYNVLNSCTYLSRDEVQPDSSDLRTVLRFTSTHLIQELHTSYLEHECSLYFRDAMPDIQSNSHEATMYVEQ